MKIAKNFIYNTSYQILVLLLPLVTVPYIARVLGPEGVGAKSYTFSIVQYFILIAILGLDAYGIREVAKVKDNRKKLSETFKSLFILRVMTVSVAFILFCLFMYWNTEFISLFWIQSLYIVIVASDVAWLFMGLEQFKKIVIRNTITKLAGLIAIFMFVKQKEDLPLYIIILIISQVAGQVTLFPYIPKYIDRVKVSYLSVIKHLKPTLAIFITQLAMQVYLVLNRTLLGIYSTTSEVGIFDSSYKIISIALALMTSISTVMLPRISALVSEGEHATVRLFLNRTLSITLLFAVGLMFGIAGISGNFMGWFLGAGFTGAGSVLVLLTPVILFLAWGSIIGNQFLLPMNRMRGYSIAVCSGLFVNVIINVLLIPQYGAQGAAVATSISEGVVLLAMMIIVRESLDQWAWLKELPLLIIAGGVMVSALLVMNKLPIQPVGLTFLQIIVGIGIYLVILYLFKTKTLNWLLDKISVVINKRRQK